MITITIINKIIITVFFYHVYLSGLGVIVSDHGSTLFSPKEKLTRAELAYWAGRFYQLQAAGASHEEISAAALEKGLLSSLEGNATYEDVNRAFFQGKASMDNPRGELTKEEFASFVYKHRTEQGQDTLMLLMIMEKRVNQGFPLSPQP